MVHEASLVLASVVDTVLLLLVLLVDVDEDAIEIEGSVAPIGELLGGVGDPIMMPLAVCDDDRPS